MSLHFLGRSNLGRTWVREPHNAETSSECCGRRKVGPFSPEMRSQDTHKRGKRSKSRQVIPQLFKPNSGIVPFLGPQHRNHFADWVSEYGYAGSYQAVRRFAQKLHAARNQQASSSRHREKRRSRLRQWSDGRRSAEWQYRRTRLFVLTLALDEPGIRATCGVDCLFRGTLRHTLHRVDASESLEDALWFFVSLSIWLQVEMPGDSYVEQCSACGSRTKKES